MGTRWHFPVPSICKPNGKCWEKNHWSTEQFHLQKNIGLKKKKKVFVFILQDVDLYSTKFRNEQHLVKKKYFKQLFCTNIFGVLRTEIKVWSCFIKSTKKNKFSLIFYLKMEKQRSCLTL